MKVVTGNRLSDGHVVYLGDDDEWAENLSNAAQFSSEDAEAVLAAAQSRVGEIADVYLIDVAADGAPVGRQALREAIRGSGPTIRFDLGYQAGA